MLTVKPELAFREPRLEDAAWTKELLQPSGFRSAEYSFTTLFMWRRFYRNQIARKGDTLFIKSQEGADRFFLLPVGGDMQENLLLLKEYAHDRGHPLKLFITDASYLTLLDSWFPGEFTAEPMRDEFDYLYAAEDLANLQGKKYHGKRNHINSFSEQYAWSYESITDSNTPDVLEMAREWCRQKGNCQDESLRSEKCAIREALAHRQALSLTGGLIRVDGKVVAFTFASPISSEVVDIHVEKALPDYAAAYAVINREFAARELGRYRYINRENDMGIEGLRRAKNSYQPALLLEKYLCTEKW